MPNKNETSDRHGLLSSGNTRKSFLTHAIELYRSNATFRGMADFAVIGAIVLMFISPPQNIVWPWSGSGSTNSGSTPAALSPSNSVLPSTNSNFAATVTGPVVPIPYSDDFKVPKLSDGFVFDIDATAFGSSSAADQARLASARIAIAIGNPDEAFESLREAAASDPNVQLLRGAASVQRATEEGNRSAEALWRSAVNGGNKQAQALLGRLLISGLPGIAQNAAEGLRLIEAGVASGDRQAMHFAGIGYLSGEFGRFDAFKASELFKRAADAGDGLSAGCYSRMQAEGIAASAPDGKQAELYLRHAAEAGVTTAQFTLGQWLEYQYNQNLITDPKEAIDWLTRAYERGHAIGSLIEISYIYITAKNPPWANPKLGAEIVKKCSGFKSAYCLFNTAYGYANGLYGANNLPLARALYEISSQLNAPDAEAAVKFLDGQLSPADRQVASAFETSILAQLKPPPSIIALQYKDIPSMPPPMAIVSDQLPARQANDQTAGDLAMCINEGANWGDERAACTRVINLGTTTTDQRARAFFERGWSNDRAKNLDAAFDDYSEAIKLVPNYAIAFNNRGFISLTKNNLEAASSDYNAALTADPKLVFALINRSQLQLLRGNFNEAIGDATAALGIEPGNTLAMLNRASANANLKNFSLAIADYNELLRLDAGRADAFTGRGWCYFSMGQNNFDRALADYAQALQLDPNYTLAYLNRAVLYRARNQLDRAISDLDTVIKIDPKNEAAYKLRDDIKKRMPE